MLTSSRAKPTGCKEPKEAIVAGCFWAAGRRLCRGPASAVESFNGGVQLDRLARRIGAVHRGDLEAQMLVVRLRLDEGDGPGQVTARPRRTIEKWFSAGRWPPWARQRGVLPAPTQRVTPNRSRSFWTPTAGRTHHCCAWPAYRTATSRPILAGEATALDPNRDRLLAPPTFITR